MFVIDCAVGGKQEFILANGAELNELRVSYGGSGPIMQAHAIRSEAARQGSSKVPLCLHLMHKFHIIIGLSVLSTSKHE